MDRTGGPWSSSSNESVMRRSGTRSRASGTLICREKIKHNSAICSHGHGFGVQPYAVMGIALGMQMWLELTTDKNNGLSRGSYCTKDDKRIRRVDDTAA